MLNNFKQPYAQSEQSSGEVCVANEVSWTTQSADAKSVHAFHVSEELEQRCGEVFPSSSAVMQWSEHRASGLWVAKCGSGTLAESHHYCWHANKKQEASGFFALGVGFL